MLLCGQTEKFKICEIIFPVIVGILASVAIIMKLMGNYVGISMGLSVAAFIVSALIIIRFVRNLPCPGVCIMDGSVSRFKARCIAYKLGLKEYFKN